MIGFTSAAGRDWLYLAVACAGLVFAFASRLAGYRIDRDRRNRCITASVLSATAMVICLSLAIITSQWSVLFNPVFYWPLLIILILAFLCLRFPRAVAFPMILTIGSLFALYSVFFNSFVSLSSTGADLASLKKGSDGLFTLRMDEGSDVTGDDSSYSFRCGDYDDFLQAAVLAVSFDQRLPLIGATTQVALIELSCGDSDRLRRTSLPLFQWRTRMGEKFQTYLSYIGMDAQYVGQSLSIYGLAESARWRLIFNDATFHLLPDP
jgi:hypothetical protein